MRLGARGTQGGQGQASYGIPAELAAGRTPEPVEIRMEERGKFHGRLLEAETGKPVAGGKLFVDAGLVLTTDAEGRFEVGGLSRAGHEMFVVAPGRLRMRVLFDTTARADTELDVSVPLGGKIIGRVTDMDGKPIPGAYVGLSGSGSYWSMNGLYMACDADGRFDYEAVVPPNHTTELNAAAPGYVEEQRGALVALPDKPIEVLFQLRPKAADPKPGAASAAKSPDNENRRTVSGVVRGPDKEPVEGVLVRWGVANIFDPIQARTNAKGRFRLIAPAKENRLAVLPRDYTPEFPSIAAGGDKTIKIALQQGRTVRGHVVDDNHNPIQNVLVAATIPSRDPNLHGNSWLLEAAVYTDAAGRFTLKGVPDGAKFGFSKPGMSTVGDYELTFDGAGKPSAVTMLYGGAVSGKVIDQDGKPIHNFRILVNFPHERRPGDLSGGFFAGFVGTGVRFTSADGGFVLTGIGAGSVLRITAIADDHGPAIVDRVTAVPLNHLADAKPVTLRTGPPIVLRVRAVTTDDKPIAGARVTLIDDDPAVNRQITWGSSGWADVARAPTTADGWADFPALSFDAATLLVEAPGFARHSEGWRNGGKELTAKLAAEAVLTGEVHDAAGTPVKSYHVALISARGDHWIPASAGPEDKGRFRVAELPAGEWTVIISSPDKRTTFHHEQVTLKAGETKELKIEVKKGPLRPPESLAP